MIPMSDRVYELLRSRADGKTQGWLFPSTRSECGHLTDLGKQFRLARRQAQLSHEPAMYRARPDSAPPPLTTTTTPPHTPTPPPHPPAHPPTPHPTPTTPIHP